MAVGAQSNESAGGFVLTRPVGPMKPLLVVLLGWTGAKMRILQKYAALLCSAGYPTVAAIIPAAAVYSPSTAPHRRFTEQLLDFLAAAAPSSAVPAAPAAGERQQQQQSGAQLPQRLVFFGLSNGGAYPIEQMDLLAREEPRYAWLKEQVAGVIFDSSPCYIFHSNSARALAEGQHLVVRALFYLSYMTLGVALYTLLFPGRAEQFWEHMTQLSLGQRELFLYSQDDHLCDAKKVEQLIQERRRQGRHVEAHSWASSEHVGHLRRHPEEYKQHVLSFLDGLC